MEHKYVKRDNGRGESEHDYRNVRKLAPGDGRSSPGSKFTTVVRRFSSKTNSIMSAQSFRSCNKDYFVLSPRDFQNWIPKHIVTVDEKYLRQCLKLISSKPLSGSSCSLSLNFSWGENENVSDTLAPFCFDSHLLSDTRTFAVSNSGRWAVGAIMESQSMKNILRNPILHQCSPLDNNLKKLSLYEDDVSVVNSVASSPSQVFYRAPQKQSTIDSGESSFEASHQRKTSTSSSNLSFSGDPFVRPSVSKRGVLQCVWKGSNPHFVFSLDDRKLVFTSKMEPASRFAGSSSDYVYMFYVGDVSQKGLGVHENGAQLVGKMIVSASFTLCCDQSRILEREFVLFGASDTYTGGMHNTSRHIMKNKGFLKKVPGVFNISHSIRKRTNSRFDGSTASDRCPWEPTQAETSDHTTFTRLNLTENHMPSNFELAAVVVRDHFSCANKSVGGWGLKFLKDVNPLESSDSPASAPIHCSTDIDVIVPAGYHGGPINRNCGPSTLTERWKSGGLCDCGGWDLGCSLTILKSRSSSLDAPCSSDAQGSIKFIELVPEGAQDTAPSLRVANVQDGVFLVDYQSNLSALQVFSIVVANIHAQSSTLRPKMYSN